MDIYEELLKIVGEEDDLEEFLTHEEKYEYLYHLSRIRQNVIEWYDFRPDARLLELGAECGALTGLFCDRVREVVAVEEDPAKSAVNEARNRDKNNLVIKRSADELEPTDKYDYVTIIGGFTVEKLRTARAHLKSDGKLILAIENKYGMKYWSGETIPETYSRMQLITILKIEGFEVSDMYYPMPDYLFPMEIYSSKSLPKIGSISAVAPSFLEDKVLSLDEIKAYDTVIKDNKFEDYANSFLAISIVKGEN